MRQGDHLRAAHDLDCRQCVLTITPLPSDILCFLIDIIFHYLSLLPLPNRAFASLLSSFAEESTYTQRLSLNVLISAVAAERSCVLGQAYNAAVSIYPLAAALRNLSPRVPSLPDRSAAAAAGRDAADAKNYFLQLNGKQEQAEYLSIKYQISKTNDEKINNKRLRSH